MALRSVDSDRRRVVKADSEDRARAVRPILQANLSGSKLRLALDDVARILGVSPRTARRLYNRLRDGDGRLSAIAPRARGPKKGGRRLDDEREALIARLLDELYLKREKMSFRRAVQEIRAEFDARGLQPPTRRTLKARLDAMDQREVARRRDGSKAARARFQPSVGKLRAERPLKVVQMDHTLADVILVDSEERKPFRRPWVTFAIDVATRMVTGVHASFDAPSALSIALCLDHSVKEKSEGEEIGTRLPDWPAFGVPERIHVDNGSDFRSKSFEDGCREWGVELKFRPPGRPHYGGHIERLIGTAMGAVHLLPGTTEASPNSRGDYDSAGKASLTLAEFTEWLKLEVRRYHRTVHSGLKMTPLDRWRELGGEDAVRRPADIAAFTLSFMPMQRRKLTREGISLFGIKYWSDAFGAMVGRSVDRYAIKYDPRDLSRIWLCAGDGRMIEARYRDLSLPVISLWEHADARRLHAKRARGVPTERALFDIIIEQRRIAETAKRLTRAERMARERDAGRSGKQVSQPRDESRKMVAIDTSSTALEAFEIEEWRHGRSTDRKD